MFCRAPLPALGSLLSTERSEWPAQLPALSSLGAPGQAIGQATGSSSVAALRGSIAATSGAASCAAVQASANQGGDAAQFPAIGLLAIAQSHGVIAGTASVAAIQGCIATTAGAGAALATSTLPANMGGGPAQFAMLGLLDSSDCRAQAFGAASVVGLQGSVGVVAGSSAVGAASIAANMGGDPAPFPFMGLVLSNLGSWGIGQATGTAAVAAIFNDGDVFYSVVPGLFVGVIAGSSTASAISTVPAPSLTSGRTGRNRVAQVGRGIFIGRR